MSRRDAGGRTSADRTSLYDEITSKIIAELEAGCVPWVQPWGTAAAKAPLAMPKNAATGRGYSGINVLILWGAVIQHGFASQGWLTFRQALALGGHVRKGERGTMVVYADRFTPDDEREHARETGDEAQIDRVPEAFHRLQCRAMRGPARGPRDRLCAAGRARADRVARRGADRGERHRFSHRRRQGLLSPGPGRRLRAPAPGLFRAH
jgi:hypothetical protein